MLILFSLFHDIFAVNKSAGFYVKKNEVTGKWRKLRSEKLHNLFSSPNIIRHIKSGRMRWARHVGRIREERKCTKFLWESPRERDHSEDQGVAGRMESEWVLGKVAGRCGVDSFGSGSKPVTSCCKCGDEPSGSAATDLVK
jgi:hypothetical protein